MDHGQKNTAYTSQYILRRSIGMDRGTTIMIMTPTRILAWLFPYMMDSLRLGKGVWHVGGGLKALGALAMFLRCITLG